MKSLKRVLIWLLYLGWAVFVNATNVWIIRPLVADFSIAGVFVVVALTLLWLWLLPAQRRRLWAGFTLFALLLGDGMSAVIAKPLSARIVLGVLMSAGLVLMAWLVSRVKVRFLAGTAAVLAACNLWLPFDDWTFLTHFAVAYTANLPMTTADLPTLPIQVVQTPRGMAIVTLKNLTESRTNIEQQAVNAVETPDALENLLRNYQHRYELEELNWNGHGFTMHPLSAVDAAAVNPLDFAAGVFPFIAAHWTVDNGRIVQYMVPAYDPRILTYIANDAANLPETLRAVAESTLRREQLEWTQVLSRSGVSPKSPTWVVANGQLVGTYRGQTVAVPVDAASVVAQGSFTAPGAHEVLLQGPNLLEVYSLDQNKMVAKYRGTPATPIPNDLTVGPVDASGRDAIFVNSVPARILLANPGKDWTVYTAPNGSLRFEASVRFAGDEQPEILTDDPSYLRGSPVRYFTSYTFRNGNLIRNWRVFATNVVNVHAVQLSPTGDPYVVAGIYGSGRIFVLRPHHIPVVPLTSAVLALSILAGAWMRWRERGQLNP